MGKKALPTLYSLFSNILLVDLLDFCSFVSLTFLTGISHIYPPVFISNNILKLTLSPLYPLFPGTECFLFESFSQLLAVGSRWFLIGLTRLRGSTLLHSFPWSRCSPHAGRFFRPLSIVSTPWITPPIVLFGCLRPPLFMFSCWILPISWCGLSCPIFCLGLPIPYPPDVFLIPRFQPLLFLSSLGLQIQISRFFFVDISNVTTICFSSAWELHQPVLFMIISLFFPPSCCFFLSILFSLLAPNSRIVCLSLPLLENCAYPTAPSLTVPPSLL